MSRGAPREAKAEEVPERNDESAPREGRRCESEPGGKD